MGAKPKTKHNVPRLRAIVKRGGGKYAGIMDGTLNGKRLFKDLVLFNSPETGSTLAAQIEGLTAKAVAEKIKMSNEVFRRAA